MANITFLDFQIASVFGVSIFFIGLYIRDKLSSAKLDRLYEEHQKEVEKVRLEND